MSVLAKTMGIEAPPPLLEQNLARTEGEFSSMHLVRANAPCLTRSPPCTLQVFVPCTLSIFVILFQRLGWVVGQAGVNYFFVMIFVGYSVVIPTVLSLSALSSNGKLKGGGAYYLISRALGPELGGAIGLIFYGANVAGCVVYLLVSLKNSLI